MVVYKSILLLTFLGSAALAVFKASQAGQRPLLRMSPILSGRRSRARLKKKPIHKNYTDVQHKTNPACCFCCRTEDNIEKYGERLIDGKGNLSAHYYCLILSSGLWQEGKEDEGFYGFLLEDIKKEVERASTIKCCICKKLGASINCDIKKCTKSFHYPCGEEKQCLFQFFDRFRSYCWEHIPIQKVPPTKGKAKCPVCLESIQPKPNYTVLKSPCCKQTWFHRQCLQKSALIAGLYHFKCAICCNEEKFVKEMLRMGIHIPERDAAWELEDNAYSELYEVRKECDVPKCLCKKGRKFYNSASKWNIVLCHYCGMMGTHLVCSALSNSNVNWICPVCFPIISPHKSEQPGTSGRKPPFRGTMNPNIRRTFQRILRSNPETSSNAIQSGSSIRSASPENNQIRVFTRSGSGTNNTDDPNSLQRLRGCHHVQSRRTRREHMTSSKGRHLC
ncbi:PHD finger protein 7-like [Ambystoma mexicanum]|uniref:PHD finger protein 7-like n=1 Tax=Ambystoma mexicanum TaxID=8296 RepID=UPI0037E87B9C